MKTELVTTLKRQATRLLSELRDSGEPVLITEHGKPAAYSKDNVPYRPKHFLKVSPKGANPGDSLPFSSLEKSSMESMRVTRERAERRTVVR